MTASPVEGTAPVEPSVAAPLGARPKFGLPTMILYGAGYISNSLKTRALATFLMIFYNQVMGLPASWVGMGLGIALVIDAIVDPVVGILSDNTRTRWGRRHPFMYTAAIPVAVLFFLLWTPPAGLSHAHLFAYMMTCLILIRVFDTFFELPATALVPELIDDYDRRTTMVVIRVLMGVVGGLMMTIFAYQVLLKEQPDGSGGMLAPDGYFWYGVTGSIVIFVSILTATIATHRFIPWLRQLAGPRKPRSKTPLREIGQTLGRRSFVTIAISGLLVAFVGSMTQGLTVYIGLFFWEFSQGQLAGLASVVAASAITGLAVAPWLSRRMGKRNAAIMGYIIGCLGELTPYGLRLTGIMPENGDPWVFRIVAIGSFVNMSAWAMTGAFLSALVADVVEDSAVKTGRRAEGIIFAADSLIKKVSSAGGPAMVAFLLTQAAFPTGAKPGQVPQSVLMDLIWIYLPTLIVIYIISITALSFYNIDRESHAANLRALEAMAADEEQYQRGEP